MFERAPPLSRYYMCGQLNQYLRDQACPWYSLAAIGSARKKIVVLCGVNVIHHRTA